MNNFALIFTGWAIIALMMTALWILQRKTKDAGIVDVGWASCLGILAILYACFAQGWLPRRLLVGLLGGVWSFRLAWYLLRNRILGKPEDGRYQTLRKNWGEQAQVKFFVFFQIQAILDIILSLPFLVLANNSEPVFYTVEYLGVVIWLISITGETFSDWQLAKFRNRAENRGKTCTIGFWRYSRHPNYFFEWLHWISYAAMGTAANYGWLTFFSPLIMLFFILKVTGIPPTEAQAVISRGDDYRRYQRTTSAFFPWFPKEDRG